MACGCNNTYEYQVLVDIQSPTTLETTLNTEGSEGWEVDWIHRSDSGYFYVLLKRKV
jgi:hypothetical protein